MVDFQYSIKAQKQIFIFLFGIVLFILIIGALLIFPVSNEYVNRIEFDSELWKAQEKVRYENPPVKSEDAPRLMMVNDLLRKYDFEGMSQKEVDLLLGKPPKTSYFSQYDYVYWLGPERGYFSIDSEWFVIKFKDGFVEDFGIVRD